MKVVACNGSAVVSFIVVLCKNISSSMSLNIWAAKKENSYFPSKILVYNFGAQTRTCQTVLWHSWRTSLALHLMVLNWLNIACFVGVSCLQHGWELWRFIGASKMERSELKCGGVCIGKIFMARLHWCAMLYNFFMFIRSQGSTDKIWVRLKCSWLETPWNHFQRSASSGYHGHGWYNQN